MERVKESLLSFCFCSPMNDIFKCLKCHCYEQTVDRAKEISLLYVISKQILLCWKSVASSSALNVIAWQFQGIVWIFIINFEQS